MLEILIAQELKIATQHLITTITIWFPGNKNILRLPPKHFQEFHDRGNPVDLLSRELKSFQLLGRRA